MLLADLGSAFLLASLVLIAFSAAVGLVAGRADDAALARVSRRAFYAATLGIAGASVTLLAALLTHDFTIAYVTEHTDRGLPAPLLAASFYGGQEGSLLYWALLLTVAGSVSLAAVAAPLPTCCAMSLSGSRHRLHAPSA